MIVLKKLRGKINEDLILSEVDELNSEKTLRSKQQRITFKDLFSNPILRKPLILTIIIQMSQVKHIL